MTRIFIKNHMVVMSLVKHTPSSILKHLRIYLTPPPPSQGRHLWMAATQNVQRFKFHNHFFDTSLNFTVKDLQPVKIMHSKTLTNLSLKFGQYSLGDCEVYFKGEKLSWGESFAIFAKFGTNLQSQTSEKYFCRNFRNNANAN